MGVSGLKYPREITGFPALRNDRLVMRNSGEFGTLLALESNMITAVARGVLRSKQFIERFEIRTIGIGS